MSTKVYVKVISVTKEDGQIPIHSISIPEVQPCIAGIMMKRQVL